MAQILEFQFLKSYTITVDVVLLGQITAVVSGLEATQTTNVSGQVARYQVTTAGLTGQYLLVVYHAGITVMTDRIIVPYAASGIYISEGILGLTLPDPSQVSIGVDRGDGLLGTLVPCFAPVRTATTEIEMRLVPRQRVEILSLSGSRTKHLARVVRILDDNLYEVLPERTNRYLILKRDRLLPIYMDV